MWWKEVIVWEDLECDMSYFLVERLWIEEFGDNFLKVFVIYCFLFNFKWFKF